MVDKEGFISASTK